MQLSEFGLVHCRGCVDQIVVRGRRVGVVVLWALVSATASQVAEGQEIIRGYLGGGVSVPVGPLATSATPAYNILLGVAVRQPFSHLALRMDGMFAEFTAPKGDSGYAQFFSFNLNPQYTFAYGPIAPYVFGGPGYYYFRGTQAQALVVSSPATMPQPYSSSHFGIDAGAGVRGKLTYFSIFLEARDHLMFAGHERRSYVPITAGISLPYPWGEYAGEGVPPPPGPP